MHEYEHCSRFGKGFKMMCTSPKYIVRHILQQSQDSSLELLVPVSRYPTYWLIVNLKGAGCHYVLCIVLLPHSHKPVKEPYPFCIKPNVFTAKQFLTPCPALSRFFLFFFFLVTFRKRRKTNQNNFKLAKKKTTNPRRSWSHLKQLRMK